MASEFQGFKPGHEHKLELLPVVESSLSYGCSCGGLLRVVLTSDLSSPLQAQARAYERLRALEQQPIPSLTSLPSRIHVLQVVPLTLPAPAERREEDHQHDHAEHHDPDDARDLG